MSSFSCFVVGDGILALSCLEILLQKDCQVLGVYSTDNSLQKWSQEHGITHAASRSMFQKTLLGVEYDYLFSINNIQWIIPKNVIARAKKATINYHDSPLPKYAGLYATSWALLNGETEYAVTWHEVSAEIDAGRIFKQASVPILADDTAFSLNLRCFDAAINSFGELIQELVIDVAKPYPQDLSQRSYFSPSDRPDAAALISYDVTSKDICNLVKALDFGTTRNELGLPKTWLPGGMIVVGSARSITSGYGTPGQVLKLDSQGMCIATIDGAVQLSRLSTLNGKDISLEKLREDYGVRVSDVIPAIDTNIRKAITERNAVLCRHEKAWAKRLMQLAAFRHPYLPLATSGQKPDISMHRYPILPLAEQVAAKSLLSMFAAYCARLTTETEFDLGLQTDAQRSIAPEIFAQRVPIRVQTQANESFNDFQQQFETATNNTARLCSFRHTLLRRYPQLHDGNGGSDDNFLPVAIVLAASSDQLDWPHLQASIAFVAYEDGSSPELIHNGSLNDNDSQAIVQQLQSFITACIEDPQKSLYQLPLLSVAEQERILVDWNDTAQTFPTDLCIHELFTIQAELTPDAVAVAFQDRELTYRELNAQVNQLAHYLRLQGVGSDVVVGLHLERSLEMMIGLLAIHKAGGAYLPLDPDFPADRLAFMVEDSQTTLILTQEKLIPHFVVDHDVRIIPIDTLWAEITQQPTTNPHSGVKPENLSYVIYTSGSTGKPKGVMVEHRHVVNFFTGMDAVIDHEPPGVWLAVTSLSFDISVLELFWTLARGFKVVIYNPKQERQQSRSQQPIVVLKTRANYQPTTESIADLIKRHQVTHLQCTPSMAGLLMAETANCKVMGQLRQMMVGGEALTEALANQLQQIIPGQIHNMYGPTETTIWSTTYTLAEVDGVVPLGRPIANTELYILDKNQQPVPVGVAGELYIGGKGVTRGYLHRPELTQERFVPNPFSDDATARLYRTGDLVRYRKDGNVEFLGRMDFQVKVRGHRIELGEIETILSRHETVREAVIIVREDIPGDKRLVAYLLPQPGLQPSSATMRTYLLSLLPEYMVPSNFVVLEKFPLTPNNKVDRKALPAPLLVVQAENGVNTTPENDIEQTLIEIWQKVLQISQVGTQDNFFYLGGNSLVAVRLIKEICSVFNVDLPLISLFKSPTIADLAKLISAQTFANKSHNVQVDLMAISR